jgi:hypothetical protein
VEFEARERRCAENLPQRRVERTEPGCVRRWRGVAGLNRLRVRPLPLRRHVLPRVPNGVREPDVLREQQQGTHELQQRSFHTHR